MPSLQVGAPPPLRTWHHRCHRHAPATEKLCGYQRACVDLGSGAAFKANGTFAKLCFCAAACISECVGLTWTPVQAVCKWFQGGYHQGSYKRERDALEVISQVPKGEGRDLWPRLLSINHDQHVLLSQLVTSPPGALADHTVWSECCAARHGTSPCACGEKTPTTPCICTLAPVTGSAWDLLMECLCGCSRCHDRCHATGAVCWLQMAAHSSQACAPRFRGQARGPGRQQAALCV